MVRLKTKLEGIGKPESRRRRRWSLPTNPQYLSAQKTSTDLSFTGLQNITIEYCI
jgi:hypothetical protein